METNNHTLESYAPPTITVTVFHPRERILNTSSQIENYTELDFWTEVEE